MEIKKLRTSIGFGKYLKDIHITELCKLSSKASAVYDKGIYMLDALKYELRNYYDDKLLQPLTKEMFVNPYEKPNIVDYATGKGYGLEYHEDLEKWQEAEKKVIFKNCKYIDIQPSRERNYWTIGGLTIAIEGNGGEMIILPKYKTIHDLVEAANGELELKNIDL